MSRPKHFLIEGLDRVGKDTLIKGIQNRLGYHQVLHFTKPMTLDCYASTSGVSVLRQYQEASFRTMFHFLRGVPLAQLICNRAHLGECVYAPLYRDYPGEYVFDLEREFGAHELPHVRLILLTENFDVSVHFVDDKNSLGRPEERRKEQTMFLRAFDASLINDKRIVCVTDPVTGAFRSRDSVLDEVLA